MYDIGSVGSDQGVDPANGVGSRRDTQGSATAYNTPNVEALTVTNLGFVVRQNRHAVRHHLPFETVQVDSKGAGRSRKNRRGLTGHGRSRTG